MASLACGLANSQALLIAARAVQGLGGAVVSAVALSLIMNLFTEPAERAKAMGVYGFVCAGGGSIGVLLGGVLTDALELALDLPGQPADRRRGVRALPGAAAGAPGQARRSALDVAGAVTVTRVADARRLRASSTATRPAGPRRRRSACWARGGAARRCSSLIEARVQQPLMPLGLFRLRNVAIANVVGVLWAAAMFAWFFISALYMQLVLGYTPMQVGLAFLPANLIMAAFSLGAVGRIVMRFGIRGAARRRAAAGRARAGAVRARAGGRQLRRRRAARHGAARPGRRHRVQPVLLAAMSDVDPSESGLASGVVNTSFMMGGALGLAVLASLAAARTGAAGRQVRRRRRR